MKQKTQMQYLIDELVDRAKTEDMISLKLVIGLAVVRLEKEKKQILDAFDAGSTYDGDWELEEKYYNFTFGDNPEAGI